MSYHQHLYRKSGSRMSGKAQTIQEWYVVVDDDTYTMYSGQKGGKMTPKSTTAKGKNIGKSNETSPAEQARIEAQAKWDHKVQRDLYKVDLNDGKEPLYLEPMLAMDATKHGHRIRWGVRRYVSQPKLNGVRVTAKHTGARLTLTSREGIDYTVEHVQDALFDVMSHGEVWDGELDLGNEYELGDVTRALKPDAENHHLMCAHIFDTVHPTYCFGERYERLDERLGGRTDLYPTLQQVPYLHVSSAEHMDIQHDANVDHGYEGIIIRDLDAPYDYGNKGEAMFKYKKFQDQEFKILDVVPDKDGTGGLFILETDNGEFGDTITVSTFTCRAKGTDAQRAHLLEAPQEYIGKALTVRFSQRLKTGVPEFNRGITKDGAIAVRDYE